MAHRCLLVGPAVGTLIGIINGLGLTLLRLPHPFIMTLGTLNAVRGLCNLVSGGQPVSGISDPRSASSASATFRCRSAVSSQSSRSAPSCCWSVYVGVARFLQKVSLGRHIFAIGGNPQAARVSGINVDGVLVFVYAASGFFAGLAALLMAGRTGSGYPNLGIGAELDAIAAVIIGGASFFGGRGTVLGVFAGVLVMGLLRNGLNLMNISAFWQQTLIGIIIILAVWIDVLRRSSGVTDLRSIPAHHSGAGCRASHNRSQLGGLHETEASSARLEHCCWHRRVSALRPTNMPSSWATPRRPTSSGRRSNRALWPRPRRLGVEVDRARIARWRI